MTDLSKFEELGMEVCEATKNYARSEFCTIGLNHTTKKGYFSMPVVDAEIIFKTHPFVVKFVYDNRRHRLYIVEVDADTPKSLTLSANPKNNDQRARSTNTTLYALFIKHNIAGLKTGNLEFDNKLNAYFVEVR